MDVLEKLNRRFTNAYEKLFRGPGDEELRPRDVLRRAVLAMEDARKEGLDGLTYVPNVYTIAVAVVDEEERQLVRAFLDADELAQALAEKIGQHGYKTRGALQVVLEEIDTDKETERVKISTRWDASATNAPSPVSESAPPEEGTVPAPRSATPGEVLALLLVQGPDGRIEELPLTAAGAQLGRGKQAGNELVLSNDGMISKKHARIAYEAGRFVLYDEGSTNGTHIGGERLTPGKGIPLTDRDEILIGQTRLVLHTQLEAHTVPSPFAKVSPASPAHALGQLTGALRLVSETGESYPLASRMLLGRALTDDVVLIGEGVCAQHARLTVREGLVRIEDLDTKTGTIVNGERIPASFPVALYPGDTIQLGALVLRLVQGSTL